MPGVKESREFQRFKVKLGVELLWIYILALLRKKPSHAYVLRKEIEKKFGFLPGNVSAYVVLYKLQSRGFVSAKEDGNRTVYSITSDGKKLLVEAKKELQGTLKRLF
ncbi:MAG: PadR family transcriptional regulator [Candidatus Diapherotrites archaeon]|nr:PadR family transcriptional regulator [Candidatus Diapherotrites archaeon]